MNNPFSAVMGWAAMLVAAPMLASCGQPAETPPLAGATIGGPFTLTNQDGAKMKLAALANRKPGDPHPFVVGTDSVRRYVTMVGECAKAGLLRLQ